MRETFAEKSLECVLKYYNYTELEKTKLKYGFEVLYTVVTKTLGILFISLFLKTIKETLILMLLYMTLRLFGHGIHAKKSSQCWVASILCYGAFPLLIKYWVVPKNYILYTGIISLICSLLWAPADTPNKPIINKKKRILDKLITVSFTIMLLIISQKNYNQLITNSIFYSFIMEIISINPLTYKIFNIPFNNYKNFK